MSESVKRFEDLDVWKRSCRLVTDIQNYRNWKTRQRLGIKRSNKKIGNLNSFEYS